MHASERKSERRLPGEPFFADYHQSEQMAAIEAGQQIPPHKLGWVQQHVLSGELERPSKVPNTCRTKGRMLKALKMTAPIKGRGENVRFAQHPAEKVERLRVIAKEMPH